MGECFIGGGGARTERYTQFAKGQTTGSSSVTIDNTKHYKMWLLDAAASIVVAYFKDGVLKYEYDSQNESSFGRISVKYNNGNRLDFITTYFQMSYHVALVD